MSRKTLKKAVRFSLSALIPLLLAATALHSQGIGELGENTHFFRPPKGGWRADTLMMGATFLRDTSKSFIVWLHRNEAGCVGALHLMVRRQNGTDTAIYLFKNKDNGTAPTRIDLTNHPLTTQNIGHLDTIFFMYRVLVKGTCDTNRRYTGPNRAPGDGFVGIDRYWSVDKVSSTVSDLQGNLYPIGRRWCVAGWIRDASRAVRTDTVEFGFEDLTPGDKDYDDIVFHVTGVFLIRPPEVKQIRLDAMPARDTIRAGDSISYRAIVVIDSVDGFGIRYRIEDSLSRANNVRWALIGDTVGGRLVWGAGPRRNNIFTATRAYKTFRIVATIVDGGVPVAETLTVYVLPNVSHQLFVEPAPTTALGLNLNRANPINTLTLPSSVSSDSVYAILRDRFENFVQTCPRTSWSVISGTTIVGVQPGRQPLGEGVVSKLGPAGTAQVRAVFTDFPANPLFSDTFAVAVDPASYDAIRFVVGTGGQKRVIDSLVMNPGRDTLIYAEGRRTDRIGGTNFDGWVAINVHWSTTGISSSIPAPTSDSVWRYMPTDTGRGTMTIRYNTTLTRTIPVIVRAGAPARIVLYPNPGQPGTSGNLPYFDPATLSYSWEAGRQRQLVGKVFDAFGIWLPQYENNSTLAQQISWTILRSSTGIGVDTTVARIAPATGAVSQFTGFRANDTVDVIATFQQGALIFKDTVRVRILHGLPERLVIEPSPGHQSPNRANPLGSMTLSPADTARTVYAVIRDAYGNYIGPADSASWISRDPLIARTTVVRADSGKAMAIRVTANRSQTFIVASQRGFIDSALVVVESITYTGIRIVVQSGGLRDIDSLVMRTDQDTTLIALGRRSDNGQWVNISVQWQSPGLSIVPSGPSAQQWRFSPAATGTGWIYAIHPSGRDSVHATFLWPLPAKLTLYPREGQPDVPGNFPYPPQTVVDTIAAGDTITFIGKLFSAANEWLSHLEVPSTDIQWSIRELSGSGTSGTLERRSGHRTTFRPTRAYRLVEITAEYTNAAGTRLTAAARFFIIAGAPHRLVIEPTPDPMASPGTDNRLGTITIARTDTVAHAYAILRDQFGNFITPDAQAQWTSLAATIVQARGGVPTLGEGVIVRRANSGQAFIVARNATNPLLVDSVLVTLATVGHDSLRIVVRDTMRIHELIIRTDQDTALQVQGKRSDNGRWEPVGATWVLSAGLNATPRPPQAADRWRFSPDAVGLGWIRVTLGNDAVTAPDTVRVMFLAGRPLSLVLYPSDTIPNANNQPYPPPNTAIAITAGSVATIAAHIFDHNGVLLGGSAIRLDSITWRIEEVSGNPPTGSLTHASGKTTRFTPLRAYNTVLIISQYKEGATVLLDTIRFQVQPGPAHRLVIEASQNWQTSPDRDNPVDTVVITTFDSYRRVYAILRDSLGNFVDYSRRTRWIAGDSTIVLAYEGIGSVGEGIIERVISGADTTTDVVAVNLDNPALTDSTVARIWNIYFKELRIVTGPDTLPLSNLAITTNDDTTLRVIGRRSDNDEWMPISAKWETSPGLGVDPAAPEMAPLWRFSPTAPGNGWIRVTLENDAISHPDTVFVTFTVGPPIRVDFVLLTPAQERIAGDTLVAVVRVRNRNGLIPGEYCTQAAYQNLLGDGGRDSLPRIFVDGIVDTLRTTGQPHEYHPQCFHNGIDTVRFVLYYAPWDQDSLHQLFVTLNGLTGSTTAFRLLPAGLDTIMVVDQRGRVFGDTTLRAPHDYLYAVSSGFDRFGNRIANVAANWGIIDGDLHPLTRPDRTVSLYIGTEGVLYDERGCIEVTYVEDPSKKTRFCLSIIAPPAELVKAVTRDESGNGYLDKIEVRFSKAVTIPLSYNLDQIRVFNEQTNTLFMVDSIGGGLGRRDSVFTLHLREVHTPRPQTSWKPHIMISGIPEADGVLGRGCEDGAGPVIWSVSKEIIDLDNRASDIVIVVLSEPIQGGDLSRFRNENLPSAVFQVWTRVGVDSFTLVPGFLDLIGEGGRIGFLNVRTALTDTLRFVMSNGNDLTSNHFLNLRVDSANAGRNVMIVDRAGNAPEKNNRKVQVVVQPQRAPEMRVFPNPTSPAAYRPLSIDYTPNARREVVNTGKGVLLSFPLVLVPGADLDQADGKLQIYDLAGNLVARAESRDMLRSVPESFRDGGVHSYDIYWSGHTDDGRKVAPGVYRAVLMLDYRNSRVQDRKYVATIGIRR